MKPENPSAKARAISESRATDYNDSNANGRQVAYLNADSFGEVALPTTLDPERAFIGATLLIPANDTAKLIELVSGTDLECPYLQAIWAAVRILVSRGEQPDPVAVFGLLRGAGVSGTPSANWLQNAQRVIIDCTERCPHPFNAAMYAAQVVEGSYRNLVERTGVRLSQIAHTSALSDLDLTLREAVERLRETRSRLTITYPSLAGDDV